MYKPQYARYESESDSESESESDTDTSTETDTTSTDASIDTDEEGFQDVNYAALAETLAETDNIDTYVSVGQTGALPLGQDITDGNGFATFTNYAVPADPSGNKLESSTQQVTTIIMVDSRDRDRNVFVQPTALTLRLPRTYKNVVNFQVLQIKLLSAFYYFRAAKQNLDISILELGRTYADPVSGQIVPAVIKNSIREGTYDIGSLLTEISTHLNNVPIFYDYPNGFADFASKFAVTGDFALNFNLPGDYVYNSLLDQFIPNPTIDTIVNFYFVNRYAGLSSYTGDQIKVAYYYPVLKEALLDQEFNQSLLNLDLPTTSQFLLPGETARSRVIYTFQGINDPVVLELITQNAAVLDTYRLEHTFRYYLINKYVLSYETQSNRVTISSPSLNTSLVNLLNTKRAEFFAAQLAANGLTLAEYNNLATQNSLLLAVLNDMYYYIQKFLALRFGVAFNSYSIQYLANPSLRIGIREGDGAQDIPSTYNSQVISQGITAATTDILSTFKVDAKPYWNRIQNLPDTTFAYMTPVILGESGTKGLPLPTWNTDTDAQDPAHPFVAPNVFDTNNPNYTEVGLLYTNKRDGYADIVVPLEAAQYTTFRFKSPVRQTIHVMTRPRPQKYRYPAYNAITYDASHVALFDNSYCFVNVPANSNMDICGITLYRIPGFSTLQYTSTFGYDYTSSLALWGGASNVLSVVNSRHFYQFNTPLPPQYTSLLAPAYTYPLDLTIQHAIPGEAFAAPLQIYLYQDRAAFMADISDNRNEKPIHYLSTFSTTTAQSTTTLTFTAYANKTYYILARSISTSFATERYQVVPSFPGGSSFSTLTSSLVGFDPLADPTTNLTNYNYAQLADPAYIQLPIQSTLWTGPKVDITTSSLTYSTTAIGYDVNGVSTDLTNYVGFIPSVIGSNAVPNATIRADPTTGYLFQANSPYNTSTQSYFYTNSQNSILNPDGAGVYELSSVTTRQTSLVHWYGTTFIPPSENQALFDPTKIAHTTIPPYTTAYPLGAGIGGYTYVDRLDLSGNPYLGQTDFLNLGDGVMGIGFLPDQGVSRIRRFMFKSVFTSSNAADDPNLATRYIGVYPAAYLTTQIVQTLALSNALAVLEFASSITYNSSNDNFGFDAAGGTYYEFLTTGSNTQTGYRQSAYEYNFDVNSYYVAVPFTAASNVNYFFGLVGSPVPYPYYSDAVIVPAVDSPLGPLYTPNSNEIVVPKDPIPGADPIYGPPPGYTATQSQYEQSAPITNNVLFYADPYPINSINTPFDAWSPFPYEPAAVVADCSGYMLLRDTTFRVFQYPAGVSTQTFVEKYQFTLDQVFPPASNIDYLGSAANESNFAFFGLSNSAGPSTSLVIRTMNPTTGTIQNTYSEAAPLGFQSSVQLFHCTYNNYGGYVMSAQGTTGLSVLGKATETTSTYTLFTYQTPNPSTQQFLIGQSPKEQYGRFWVFPQGLDTGGVQEFAYVNPNTAASPSPPAGTYQAATGPLAGPATYTNVLTYTFTATPASTFTSPIVTRDVAQDRIFFLSPSAPTRFFEAPIVTGVSTITTLSSVYTFPSSPTALYAGASGAKWALIYETMYGNRADAVDGPRSIKQAWQIFYPVHRVVFDVVSKQFNPMTPQPYPYPEYPHTAVAVYDGSGNITADTSAKWGLESASNFITADFQFSGPYFNAYDYAVPVYDNRGSLDYYYMTIRNYTPTEKSQVVLRVSAPNRYTFGYVTPLDISGEISVAKHVSSTNNRFETFYWDPIYQNSLLAFDSNFTIDSNGLTFGGGVIQGYGGSNISSVTGWGDFYGRFLQVFSTYSTQVQLVSTINTNVNIQMSNFIQTDLQYIIPTQALNRQRFTDPVRFSILWKSALLPAYAALEEEWGLGWNLGYAKADTPYETIHKADTFFKILDDYIFLRLNPEFDMNRMDTTLKENLAATQEPTGTTKSFYGKLLLANFGSYAQTMISNPLVFTPSFGKMDKLTFNWVDHVGAVIDNDNCEWNAVVQIVENVDIVALPKPMLLSPVPAETTQQTTETAQ